MSENQPVNSVLTIEGRSMRYFGRILQLVATQEGTVATPTNWAETCQSLQAKIQILVRELDLKNEQVEALTTQNMVLKFRNDQQADEIFYLKDEMCYLREELDNRHTNLPPIEEFEVPQSPSSPQYYFRNSDSNLVQVIDEIELD